MTSPTLIMAPPSNAITGVRALTCELWGHTNVWSIALSNTDSSGFFLFKDSKTWTKAGLRAKGILLIHKLRIPRVFWLEGCLDSTEWQLNLVSSFPTLFPWSRCYSQVGEMPQSPLDSQSTACCSPSQRKRQRVPESPNKSSMSASHRPHTCTPEPTAEARKVGCSNWPVLGHKELRGDHFYVLIAKEGGKGRIRKDSRCLLYYRVHK